MQTLLQDLRYAVRTLLRSPGFTVVAVLTLALGIGANTAIFSVVDGVLLRPAPFENMDRLVMVWETDRNSGTTREPASVPDYLDFREHGTRFEELAAFMGTEVNLTPVESDPIRLAGLAVSHEFLPMTGVRPLLGRTFNEEEDQAGGPSVALISEGLWERLFSRDPAAIGRTLDLNDVTYTIVGVLPETADFGTLQILDAAAYGRSFAERGDRIEVDVWVPLQPDPETTPRETHPIFVLGRLAPGATPASVQQEMSRIAAELEEAYPVNDGRGVFIQPLPEVVFAPVRPTLLVLLGAVALVLLVACANVANLLLARGTTRVREVAVRMALGAGTHRLARQFLVESIFLTLVAAVLGVALAFIGLDLLLGLAPADIPRLSAVEIDERVLGVALAMSVLVGVVFGMIPTFQARRMDLQSSLKGEARRSASAGRERHGLRSTLVVAELALAVVLVIGAGLLIKSFWRLQQVDPGFSTEGVLKAEYQLPQSRYPADFSAWPNFQEIHRFNDALSRQAEALPGVESVAIARNHPLDAGFTNSFTVVGRETEAEDWPEISIRSVSPGYFSTLGIPLVRGRLLRDSDDPSSSPVLLINEAASRRFFPDQDPLGQQISFWGADRTIVGVVENEKIHGLTEATPPAVYTPLAQAPPMDGGETLLLRVNGDPAALAQAVGATIHQLDPALVAFGVEPLERTLSGSLGQRRFTMLLLGVFAGLALLLAVVGVYGVVSYTVAQRTREIGIRMALGAEPADVHRLFVIQGMALALGGLALGLLAAFAVTRVLSSLLYGVRASDPLTFVIVALLLAAVALLAAYLPARRAARVDPMIALRAE